MSFLAQRAATMAARRAVVAPVIRRSFATSMLRLDAKKPDKEITFRTSKCLADVKTEQDLLGVGAAPGTIPSDMEQATGLERLELLGKMEGVDIFDMRPLDASRLGTMSEPIKVQGGGPEQYLGCTGCPADSHIVTWLTVSRDRPIERCPECGSVYEYEYIGLPDDGHHDEHHHGPEHPDLEEPKTFADFIKPEYRYK
jgi:cytochrome c oxidase subunit 5b